MPKEPDALRCPTCNAAQAPLDECRRCKCDLSLFAAVWRQCAELQQACLQNLAVGEIAVAERCALNRWELSPDADAARLLATIYLLQHRYQAAMDIAELPPANARR